MALLLGLAPSPAAALQPPRPLPGYHARFVTQTDEHPMNDCLWASAAMLIDKWTNGKMHPSHQRLRGLSGDHVKGSNFDDLKVATRKLGLHFTFSPDGGNRISFHGLLRRLAHGAGAIVLGDYSRLPRWYGRWDYGFWHMSKKDRKKHASRDNHAVYVERFDRRRGRVWLMDPLGRAGWKGEWISVWSLRRFAWSSGGALFVAVTPTAKPAPFAHVKMGAATLTQTSAALEAKWSLRAPRKWRFPGVSTKTTFSVAKDPLLAAATSPEVAERVTDESRPSHTVVASAGRSLTVKAPLPNKAGTYFGSIRLADRRFGRTVAQVGSVPVFVPGPRNASLELRADEVTAEAGKRLETSVTVENTGELTWAETPTDPDDPDPEARNARLVARWIPLNVNLKLGERTDADGNTLPAVPPPTTLDSVPLDAGRHVVVDASVRAPWVIGRWALVVDVVDDIDGSYARLGSEPAVMILEVIAPKGRVEID